MSPGSIGALLSAWLLGGLIVAAVRPAGEAGNGDRLLHLSLGLLVGLGVTSTGFFFASLASSRPALLSGAVELALGLALAWMGWRRRAVALRTSAIAVTPASWRQWLLASVLAQAVLVAVVCGWRAYQAEPYGGWDGWAIWNLHARLMLRAGPEWPALLAEPAISWTHPDYPRLLPAAVARLWAWGGQETSAAAALVAVAFALAALGILLAVLARCRGWTVAFAGALLLVSTPFFVTFAPNQHADIPLGGFLLAAMGLLVLSGDGPEPRAGLWLAGLCAGLAAWTKNEGLLFALGFALVAGGWAWRRHGVRALVGLATGLGVGLVPVAVFKFGFAPANDLVSAPLGPRLAHVVDVARHATILGSFGRELLRFGEWAWAPFLAMALPFAAWRQRRRSTGTARVLWVVIGLMLAGYYGVYLLTPQDLAWHLNTSLVRLLLQLWPLAILAWALAVPEFDAGPAPARSGWRATFFFTANFVVALTLTTLLERQAAPGEMAVGRGRTRGVTVALGEGWFAPERHGRDHWAWSVGRATVVVHAGELRNGKPVTLRFGLRSSGARTVTVTVAGRTLWQGMVAGELVPVELADIGSPSGLVRLEFSTDTPGKSEAPGDGGRVLAFAIYNVELR
ncbi:MAG: glycosyltransferase family 39 protein [Opitutaceae bacterium]|nr:glycosyltransferase family 39 protein [Opitutaceae bacterium]